MCGIAGYFSFNDFQSLPDVDALLSRSLQHRGPDENGGLSLKHGTLVHTRLSIIDLKNGKQPMSLDPEDIHISFNGEIFNYLEIREELLAKGHSFKTQSDTEVILRAYLEYGESLFEKLNGQFAFALYDGQNKKAYLARDRMGEKPLYLYSYKDTVFFASELKALFEVQKYLGQDTRVEVESLFSFLSLNYVPHESTLAQTVTRVAPGSYLTLSDGGSRARKFAGLSSKTPSKPELSSFSSIFEKAVELRTRSDVPVGLFLSGGLDSTSVAVALKRMGKQPTAFIGAFEDKKFSEAPQAVEVAEKLGLDYEIIPIAPSKSELPQLIEEIVYHADDPLADSSALPMYLLSQGTARRVKVALSGDGADELFGGYLTHRATLMSKKLPSVVRKALHSLQILARVFPATGKVSMREKSERLLSCMGLDPGCAHFAWNGMFSDQEKRRLLSKPIRELIPDVATFASLADYYGIDRKDPSLNQILLADQSCYLRNDILVKVDRMSMAHGLEVRPVFLDPQLIHYANSLPPRLRLHAGRSKIAVREYVNSNFDAYRNLDKAKQGFSIPIHSWFRTILKDYAEEELFSGDAKHRQFFDMQELEKLWTLHQQKKRQLGFHLWGILVFAVWLRKFSVSDVISSDPAKV